MMAELSRSIPGLACRLTVTRDQVPDLSREISRLGLEDSFDFLGPVTPERSRQVIADALVSVIPSKLESFGLPYYESLSLGTPVIAADRDFAREACGPAALYAAPDDPGEFAANVTATLANWNNRHHASLARFREVDRPWSLVAREYLKILEAL
jgi:glycosyltransferase involved in cell wall biosynthesis